MNRYNGPQSRTVSQASATTLCQKCLKRGHYSYECKAPAQERPYVARPSRTQQLFNPKLAPKLSEDVPNELLRKQGVADEQLAKNARSRREERRSSPELRRSASTSSSDSVSTVSTNASHRSATRQRKSGSKRQRNSSPSDSQSYKSHDRSQSRERYTRRRRASLSPKHRGRRHDRKAHKERRKHSEDEQARKTRRENHQFTASSGPRSPVRSGHERSSRSVRTSRRSRSRSPAREYDGERYRSRDRASASDVQVGGSGRQAARERSLSPFSKRKLMTMTM